MHDDTFLQAIIENPDDDGLRLIYADYLDERGDTRGQFIRVQIALASLPNDDPRRGELEARERRLLAEYEGDWVKPWRRLAKEWKFRRGFVETATMYAAAFLVHADKLFAIAPVQHLTLREPQARMAGVAASPYLRRLTALSLSDNRTGDEGLRDLLGSPHLGRLKRLVLFNTGIGPTGVRALAASPMLSQLTQLDLGANHLGDEGAEAFAASPHLRLLNWLSMDQTFITATGV